MAAEDFISAKDRLEQAKKEAIWLVSVSNDLASYTKDYDLAPEEQAALLLESKKHLVEIKKAMGIPSWVDPQMGPLKDRLEQAKKEAIWLVSVSNDLASYTKDYDLATEEQEALFLESRKHLVEIKEAIAGVRIEGIPSWTDPTMSPPLPGIPSWPDPTMSPPPPGIIASWPDEEEAKRGRAGGDKPAQENEDRS